MTDRTKYLMISLVG